MTKLTPQNLLVEMLKHEKLDNFIQGEWIKDGKGCMWGCTMQSSEDAIEKACERYQIPLWLGHLAEAIFEGLSTEYSKSWPVDCIRAFCSYEGDTKIIEHELAILRLTPLAENNPTAASSINAVIDCHQKFIDGDLDIDWVNVRDAAKAVAASSEACSAALSADSAADSAKYSAEAVTYSAAYSAAWKIEAENLLSILRNKEVSHDNVY